MKSFVCLCLLFTLTPSLFAMSLSQWRVLDSSEKHVLIESGNLESEETRFSLETNVELKENLLKMKNDIVDSVGTEPIDNDVWNMEMIFTIGPIEIGSVEKFYIESELVAVNIWLYQSGGATINQENAQIKHFDTEAQALSAGMDVNADVSWQVGSTFEITTQGYSEVLIDLWDEGGFRWTGW